MSTEESDDQAARDSVDKLSVHSYERECHCDSMSQVLTLLSFCNTF